MYQSRWAPRAEEGEEQPSDLRPTSSLSASAPTFSPQSPAPALAPTAPPPPPDVSSNDSFAQTGAPQDALFDDVIPVDESMRIRSEDDLFSDDFTPVAQPVVERAAPVQVRGRGDGQRSRGRARGRGRGGTPARTESNGSAQPTPAAEPSEPPAQSALAAPENAPTGPRKESVVTAVRGDRHATGGVKKPKLTEGELAEKMAKIQIRNAELSAAHARAEADAASFAEREAQTKQKAVLRQREERKDRQQMMGEREKNRLHKLRAVGGREWDAEKNGEDFDRGGKHDRRGGFAGDQEDCTDGREYLLRDAKGAGGRGGGRGGQTGVPRQTAPKQEEFPALPARLTSDVPENDANAGAEATPTREDLGSVTKPDDRSWADQVESSNT